VDEFKLLYRLNMAASEAKTRLSGAPKAGCSLVTSQPLDAATTCPSVTVERLSEFCNLIVECRDSDAGTAVGITLQASIMSKWVNLACYVCDANGATRAVLRKDGSTDVLKIGLPSEIVEQMAKEDFRRNWHLYYNTYFVEKHTPPMQAGAETWERGQLARPASEQRAYL
jgi:hypothetical protein